MVVICIFVKNGRIIFIMFVLNQSLNHENLSLQIIAGVKKGEEEALRIAEGQWISRLGTLDTQGGSIH